MAANDLTAIGALRLMHRNGVRVPEDISVVGFDDIALSDIMYPPLTTIRLPRHELAEAFYKALDAFRKDSHAAGSQYVVNTSLVIRESTGPLRKSK
jgi:DNA-binding LacI/PurR family transcriptional regulator